MKKHILPIITVGICAVAVLFAVWALFGRKYIPTHDGEYHIIRIVQFAKMLGAGYWFPRWAPTMNSGYGIPVFEYNYPLPDYVGSAVRVINHDAVRAFQMSEGIGFIVAAAALFGWLFTLFGLVPAAIGATVGMFVPYWFVDAYVRGSIGEIWATAFLFVVLFCVEKKKYVLMAIAYALLILSHNILAMVYTPFIFIYVLIRDKKSLWSMLGGIGLSAYFWLPALLEEKYVVGLNTVNFRDNFVQLYELLIPSWGTEFSATGSMGNKMSFQLGIAPIISLIAAVILNKEKDKKIHQLFIYFLIVIAVSIFAMLSISEPIWELVKPFQFMQYPWRLLSFVIPVTGFMTGYWVSHIKKYWVGVVFAIIAILLSSSYVHPVLYEPRSEAYYLARPNFTDGTSSMGNSFSTIWTGWKDTRPEKPVDVQNGKIVSTLLQRYLDKEYLVSMTHDGELIVNTIYFPGWIATIDTKQVPINYQKDGIIHIVVPQGNHTVRVTLVDTGSRKLGNIISVLSLVSLASWGILRSRRKA